MPLLRGSSNVSITLPEVGQSHGSEPDGERAGSDGVVGGPGDAAAIAGGTAGGETVGAGGGSEAGASGTAPPGGRRRQRTYFHLIAASDWTSCCYIRWRHDLHSRPAIRFSDSARPFQLPGLRIYTKRKRYVTDRIAALRDVDAIFSRPHDGGCSLQRSRRNGAASRAIYHRRRPLARTRRNC